MFIYRPFGSSMTIKDITDWIQGNRNDQPIFEEINQYSKTLGLDVAFSTFVDSEHSALGIELEDGCLVRSSLLSLYVKFCDGYRENPVHSFLEDKYVEKKIIDEWKRLFISYGYDVSANSEHVSLMAHDVMSLYLAILVSETKSTICKEIQETDRIEKPSYVFTSTDPAYNIVYSGAREYMLACAKGETRVITDIVKRALESKDLLGYYTKDKVKVNYYHAKMKHINLYGIFRED